MPHDIQPNKDNSGGQQGFPLELKLLLVVIIAGISVMLLKVLGLF